jgi:hypothetical protein
MNVAKSALFISAVCGVLLVTSLVTSAFKSAKQPVKCFHEFVRSEDSVIKIQKYELDGQAGYYPVGRKNGPMLICIICHYKTPQVYDYGDVNKDLSEKKTSGKNYH